MKEIPYQNFQKYVLRSPLLSLKGFHDLTRDKVISESSMKSLCNDPVIREALYLASPGFFNQIERWVEGKIINADESERISYSVLKYFSRMSSRCTPFGLFAGTAIGDFGEGTNIELEHHKFFNRHTRLDMNYLVALTQDLVNKAHIKYQLRYTPNNSIYVIGNQLRYVEYHYVNSRRIHQTVALDHSGYLEQVIDVSQNGALPNEISKALVSDEITADEALAYVDELIDMQFLVSELEPCVSGPEFLDQIIPLLKGLKDTEATVETLEKVAQRINDADCCLGNDPGLYAEIGTRLKDLGTKFEDKYLIQTDLSLKVKNNQLDKSILNKVRMGFALLNKISFPVGETGLTQFGKALYERYESRPVSLALAMDVESGIGYGRNRNSGDVSVLVDDLVLPQKRSSGVKMVKESPLHSLLRKKLLEVYKKEDHILQLKDDDFEHFQANWQDLPTTVSSLVEIVKIEGEEKVVMSGMGGSNAANLMGRFCHGSEELHTFTRKIIQKEENLHIDEVLAEIVHLPESRLGNILMRPRLRAYEIPYLAKSILPLDKQLDLNDLRVVSTHEGEVTLTSNKLNKRVLPRLTNAHNYGNNALPVYQFLGDLQMQEQRWIGFRWGPLEKEYDFLPRVEYKDVIFSDAQWRVTNKELKPLIEVASDDELLTEALRKWKVKRKIPQYFLLMEGDNKLLINSDNLTSLRVFLNEMKNKYSCIIKEFLHSAEAIVTKEANYFTNQILISFFKNEQPKTEGHARK